MGKREDRQGCGHRSLNCLGPKKKDKNIAKRILKAYGCTFLESEVILYFTEMQTQQL